MRARYWILGAALVTCLEAFSHAGTVPYADQVIADGAIGYWRLGDAAGAVTAVNSGLKGAALNGTYSGSGKKDAAGLIVTNPSNTAASFIRDTDHNYVSGTGLSTAGPGGANVFAGDFTIEAWFVHNSLAGTDTVFSNNYGLSSTPNLTFGGDLTKLYFMNTGVSWGDAIGIDLGSGHLGKTVYVAATYTKSTNTVSIRANVGGTWLTPVLDQTVKWTLQASDGFFIGKHGWSWPTLTFDGTIDEVAIYATALSPAQIENHYALAAVPEPGAIWLLTAGIAGLATCAWRTRR